MNGLLRFSRACPRALVLGVITQGILINGLNGDLRGCPPPPPPLQVTCRPEEWALWHNEDLHLPDGAWNNGQNQQERSTVGRNYKVQL